ncbi:FIG00471280: hypothetical protein [hydrothermal vent metagenome]|uniref:GGDEF domain-containing protein n=1 Tax=hydrothermal vent metagenome TaxID=652676 RepID=A0A1W1D318_9ZZZZ
MSKYLYGASVQGIQDFIFKTNKLKEIVGASEIVKDVANEFLEISGYNEKDEHILLNAAGNIKAVFDSYEECQKVVLEFSKKIQQKAYGITISQAVVEFNGEPKEFIGVLETKLKIQRNKPSIPLDLSLNITKLSPKTAKPMVAKEEDRATQQKLQAYQEFLEKNPHNKEFKELQNFSNTKNKIAVIHIDGNGLGELIPKLKIPLNEFSQKLDYATKEAFKDAKTDTMDIRDVILGGDDVTVICNADDALEFSKRFLQNFEKNTKELGSNGLTACGGIAYCNEKYPLHYALSLAEELCSQAKKHAKNINKNFAPSCMMFHNIQSSNFQSWDKFIEDELTISNDKEIIRCDFGPYYLSQEKQPLLQNFQNSVNAYRCEGSPISRLRNWMSELNKSDEYASNLLQRINTITSQSNKYNCEIMDRNLEKLYSGLSDDTLIIQKDGHLKTPIYNILQIISTTDYKDFV